MAPQGNWEDSATEGRALSHRPGVPGLASFLLCSSCQETQGWQLSRKSLVVPSWTQPCSTPPQLLLSCRTAAAIPGAEQLAASRVEAQFLLAARPSPAGATAANKHLQCLSSGRSRLGHPGKTQVCRQALPKPRESHVPLFQLLRPCSPSPFSSSQRLPGSLTLTLLPPLRRTLR